MNNDRIAQLKKFLADNPDDCFLNHALALEYVKLDEDTAAAPLFEKNKNQDPNYLATYYHFGKLQERAGNANLAMATYEAGMLVAKAEADNRTYNELQAAFEDLAY